MRQCPNCAEMIPLGTLKCPNCMYALGQPDIPTHLPDLSTGPIADFDEVQPDIQRSGDPTMLLMATQQQQIAQPSRLRITRRLEHAIKRFRRQERYITAGTIGVVIAALVAVALIVTLIYGLRLPGSLQAHRSAAETATQPQMTPVASQDPPTAVITPTTADSKTKTPTATASPTTTPSPTPTATPLPANAATFLQIDTTHQGNWKGIYGQGGADVIDDTSSTIPKTIQISPSEDTVGVWSSSATDTRALQRIGTGRIAAYMDNATSFTIDINITDGQTHQFAVYVLDWENQGFAERIDLLDGTSDTPLDSENVANFNQGKYLVWNVRGHIILRVTNTAGTSKNAVVSGLFFG